MFRQATEDDVAAIKSIAAKNVRELGFILRPALLESIEKSELLYEDESQSFCRYHKRRDGVTVVYELCVPENYRRRGLGSTLIRILNRPVQLKCPVDLESNDFYKKLGFKLVETVQGKKRQLNVWRLD